MGRRQTSGTTPAPGSLTGALSRIESLIAGGGQIMLGTVKPIVGAAVAHDGDKTLAMLRILSGESVLDLLVRLEHAIGHAQASGKRVDEINQQSSNHRYEL